MVEVIDDVAAFERMREDWTRLLRASVVDSLFLTWEWLFTWWTHLAGHRRLYILTVRSGGELIAIAPFARTTPLVASHPSLPPLEFLGTGTVGSEYLDLIVRRGFEEEALGQLERHLESQGIVLELAQPKTRRFKATASANLQIGKGWSRLRRPTAVCALIQLNKQTWESYLSSTQRYHFNRRLKQARKGFDVSFEQARTPEECRFALGQLMRLHNLRWQGHGGSDALRAPAIVRFHHAMALLALDRRWLRLFVLRFDGLPVGVLYGFLYQQVFYFYQSGYDPRYRNQSVGLLTLGLAIKSAIEEGAEQYDMLQGNESYKSLWANDVRKLEHLDAARRMRAHFWRARSARAVGR